MVLFFRLIDTTYSVVGFYFRDIASVFWVNVVGLTFLIDEKLAVGLSTLRAELHYTDQESMIS